MRRAAAWLLALALMMPLAACAPDNVLTPDPDETQNGGQTDTEQQGQPANTTDQTASDETDDTLTAGAKYLLSKKENKGVVPTLKFDGSQTLEALTETVPLTIYVDDGESFWNIDEQKWLEDVSDSYKISLTVAKRPAASLCSSQLIAVKAGLPLDLIYCRAENCAQPLTLMQDMSDLASPEGDEPYILRAFETSGRKLMLPKGSCKALWYDKTKVNGDPLAEFLENVWTFERLSQYGDQPLGAAGWLPFASASSFNASGVDGDKYFLLNDSKTESAIKAFSALSGGKDPLFGYLLTPDKKLGHNSAVPIPRVGDDGKYVVSFAGGALGLSAKLDEQKRQAAGAFIKLWCTRATEARTDLLMFGSGVSAADADAFLTFCDMYGDAYEFDGTINETYSEAPTDDADGGQDKTAEYRAARLDILNARR